MKQCKGIGKSTLLAGLLLSSAGVYAETCSAIFGCAVQPVIAACAALPTHAQLKTALDAATATVTSGLNFHMWATMVNRDGIVCAVAYSGANRGAQWPGSRVISAQKANTANAFSLNGLALSTANLYSAVQPGGSLFGLQESNPVNTEAAYGGSAWGYGQANDFMVGKRIGGVNVFGGGLGLYATGEKIIGGVGVSGDTSCADHHIAWHVRHNLGLDHLQNVAGPAGLFAADPTRPDNIIFDIAPDSNGHPTSVSGFGHPSCLNTELPSTLPAVQL